MTRLNSFFGQFKSECLVRDLPYETIYEEEDIKGVLILKQNKSGAQHLRNSLSESAKDYCVQIEARNVENGVMFVFGSSAISEDNMSALALEANKKYNSFYGKLEDALGEPVEEAQIKSPSDAHGRASASDGFPNRFTAKELKKSKAKKSIDNKIDEAFEGIATPDDAQPKDIIKALLGAMKDSGLATDLKAAGISWHVAKPGMHMITFNNGKIPVVQKSTIELADAKAMGELLSTLRSIADGKAPEAGQIELEMMQQQAKDAREKQKGLTDIATQYTAQVNPQQDQLDANARQ